MGPRFPPVIQQEQPPFEYEKETVSFFQHRQPHLVSFPTIINKGEKLHCKFVLWQHAS
jgi:hypothetical protein